LTLGSRVVDEEKRKASRSAKVLGMLKERERILIIERKMIVLRVDAAYSIQALSCQKEKTISVLSALTSARGS
jgi:hypothetical protein